MSLPNRKSKTDPKMSKSNTRDNDSIAITKKRKRMEESNIGGLPRTLNLSEDPIPEPDPTPTNAHQCQRNKEVEQIGEEASKKSNALLTLINKMTTKLNSVEARAFVSYDHVLEESAYPTRSAERVLISARDAVRSLDRNISSLQRCITALVALRRSVRDDDDEEETEGEQDVGNDDSVGIQEYGCVSKPEMERQRNQDDEEIVPAKFDQDASLFIPERQEGLDTKTAPSAVD